MAGQTDTSWDEGELIRNGAKVLVAAMPTELLRDRLAALIPRYVDHLAARVPGEPLADTLVGLFGKPGDDRKQLAKDLQSAFGKLPAVKSALAFLWPEDPGVLHYAEVTVEPWPALFPYRLQFLLRKPGASKGQKPQTYSVWINALEAARDEGAVVRGNFLHALTDVAHESNFFTEHLPLAGLGTIGAVGRRFVAKSRSERVSPGGLEDTVASFLFLRGVMHRLASRMHESEAKAFFALALDAEFWRDAQALTFEQHTLATFSGPVNDDVADVFEAYREHILAAHPLGFLNRLLGLRIGAGSTREQLQRLMDTLKPAYTKTPLHIVSDAGANHLMRRLLPSFEFDVVIAAEELTTATKKARWGSFESSLAAKV